MTERWTVLALGRETRCLVLIINRYWTQLHCHVNRNATEYLLLPQHTFPVYDVIPCDVIYQNLILLLMAFCFNIMVYGFQ